MNLDHIKQLLIIFCSKSMKISLISFNLQIEYSLRNKVKIAKKYYEPQL